MSGDGTWDSDDDSVGLMCSGVESPSHCRVTLVFSNLSFCTFSNYYLVFSMPARSRCPTLRALYHNFLISLSILSLMRFYLTMYLATV